MKLYRKHTSILFVLFSLLLTYGCVDDYHDDPNRPVEVGPELILPEILSETIGGQVNTNSNMASRYMVTLASHHDYQYYDWKRSSFGNYDVIKQAVKMEEAAEAEGTKAIYEPISKFIKVQNYLYMSSFFGDIPYFKAVEEEIDFPEYDKQKDIYMDALKVLEEVNGELADLQSENSSLEGDIIYGGNILKWQKLINSYRLRTLMDMSIKTSDQELGIIEEFKAIIENPDDNPIMESNDDNALLPYQDDSGARYPYYKANDMSSSYYIEKYFVDRLKTNKDPRLFRFAEEKNDLSNVDKNDPFSFYEGADGSATVSTNADLAAEGKISRFNPHYWEDPEIDPSVFLSYAELKFILSEAIVREWIDGDPEELYFEGIEASMEFFGIDEADASDYLSNSSIKLQPGKEIEQIMNEKHTALFFNTEYQIFLDNRRTGYPEFNTSGDGALHDGKIPKRWMYPNSEINNNNDHMVEALERQFGGEDNLYAEMWLIK